MNLNKNKLVGTFFAQFCKTDYTMKTRREAWGHIWSLLTCNLYVVEMCLHLFMEQRLRTSTWLAYNWEKGDTASLFSHKKRYNILGCFEMWHKAHCTMITNLQCEVIFLRARYNSIFFCIYLVNIEPWDSRTCNPSALQKPYGKIAHIYWKSLKLSTIICLKNCPTLHKTIKADCKPSYF